MNPEQIFTSLAQRINLKTRKMNQKLTHLDIFSPLRVGERLVVLACVHEGLEGAAAQDVSCAAAHVSLGMLIMMVKIMIMIMITMAIVVKNNDYNIDEEK